MYSVMYCTKCSINNMTKEKRAFYGSTTTATTPTNQGLGGELYLFFNSMSKRVRNHAKKMSSDCILITNCIVFTDA